MIMYLYFYLIAFSLVGYGLITCKYLKIKTFNFGTLGLIGISSLALISFGTSLFFKHGQLFNSLILILGLIFLILNLNRIKNLKKEIIYTFLIFLFLLLFISIGKNHDDFPYYHLTYALNLSENSFIVGTGHFSHGFRTFSSLFFFHSILYMPWIDFYLFHSGPFFILIFFNLIILSNLINNYKKQNFNFIYFFSILSFIFINIAFYRIAEHGTDRSAQILLILIFIFFFEIMYVKKDKKEILNYFSILLILIFLASSMKVIYYLYLILIPIIIFKKKIFKDFLIKKNFLLISIVSLSFFLNLSVNYLNTGCLLYPAEKTCIIKQEWSIEKKEVKRMSLHYEWWAKAGGGPGYVSDIKPETYVKNFNWLSNWIDRHFFNKVSDTLLGIIFINFFVFIIYKYFSKSERKSKIRFKLLGYVIPSLFLLEWFINHPSMRYGGYVLFAIPFFLLSSQIIEKYNFEKKIIRNISIFFIILAIVFFNARNVSRIIKENKIYNYDVFKSPFFYVDKVESIKITQRDQFNIYSTKNNKMCWASKTPCSYSKTLGVKKFLWMNMVYKND